MPQIVLCFFFSYFYCEPARREPAAAPSFPLIGCLYKPGHCDLLPSLLVAIKPTAHFKFSPHSGQKQQHPGFDMYAYRHIFLFCFWCSQPCRDTGMRPLCSHSQIPHHNRPNPRHIH